MNFAFYEHEETYSAPENYGAESSTAANFSPLTDSVKLFTDKFLVPPLTTETKRPRLIEQTEKSLAQFSATIITGRAGMGKTTLAAQFAAQSKAKVSWYKVETADGEWKVFASYLLGSLRRLCPGVAPLKFDEAKVAAQSEQLAARFVEAAEAEPLLIVIDDLHSVYDAHWFAEFFAAFVPSLSSKVKVLLVARALPPLAVWRLRSKQVLGVVEEKTLNFTLEETVELFHKYDLSPKIARVAHQTAYGKISKLKDLAERKSTRQS